MYQFLKNKHPKTTSRHILHILLMLILVALLTIYNTSYTETSDDSETEAEEIETEEATDNIEENINGTIEAAKEHFLDPNAKVKVDLTKHEIKLYTSHDKNTNTYYTYATVVDENGNVMDHINFTQNKKGDVTKSSVGVKPKNSWWKNHISITKSSPIADAKTTYITGVLPRDNPNARFIMHSSEEKHIDAVKKNKSENLLKNILAKDVNSVKAIVTTNLNEDEDKIDVHYIHNQKDGSQHSTHSSQSGEAISKPSYFDELFENYAKGKTATVSKLVTSENEIWNTYLDLENTSASDTTHVKKLYIKAGGTETDLTQKALKEFKKTSSKIDANQAATLGLTATNIINDTNFDQTKVQNLYNAQPKPKTGTKPSFDEFLISSYKDNTITTPARAVALGLTATNIVNDANFNQTKVNDLYDAETYTGSGKKPTFNKFVASKYKDYTVNATRAVALGLTAINIVNDANFNQIKVQNLYNAQPKPKTGIKPSFDEFLISSYKDDKITTAARATDLGLTVDDTLNSTLSKGKVEDLYISEQKFTFLKSEETTQTFEAFVTDSFENNNIKTTERAADLGLTSANTVGTTLTKDKVKDLHTFEQKGKKTKQTFNAFLISSYKDNTITTPARAVALGLTATNIINDANFDQTKVQNLYNAQPKPKNGTKPSFDEFLISSYKDDKITTATRAADLGLTAANIVNDANFDQAKVQGLYNAEIGPKLPFIQFVINAYEGGEITNAARATDLGLTAEKSLVAFREDNLSATKAKQLVTTDKIITAFQDGNLNKDKAGELLTIEEVFNAFLAKQLNALQTKYLHLATGGSLSQLTQEALIQFAGNRITPKQAKNLGVNEDLAIDQFKAGKLNKDKTKLLVTPQQAFKAFESNTIDSNQAQALGVTSQQALESYNQLGGINLAQAKALGVQNKDVIEYYKNKLTSTIIKDFNITNQELLTAVGKEIIDTAQAVKLGITSQQAFKAFESNTIDSNQAKALGVQNKDVIEYYKNKLTSTIIKDFNITNLELLTAVGKDIIDAAQAVKLGVKPQQALEAFKNNTIDSNQAQALGVTPQEALNSFLKNSGGITATAAKTLGVNQPMIDSQVNTWLSNPSSAKSEDINKWAKLQTAVNDKINLKTTLQQKALGKLDSTTDIPSAKTIKDAKALYQAAGGTESDPTYKRKMRLIQREILKDLGNSNNANDFNELKEIYQAANGSLTQSRFKNAQDKIQENIKNDINNMLKEKDINIKNARETINRLAALSDAAGGNNTAEFKTKLRKQITTRINTNPENKIDLLTLYEAAGGKKADFQPKSRAKKSKAGETAIIIQKKLTPSIQSRKKQEIRGTSTTTGVPTKLKKSSKTTPKKWYDLTRWFTKDSTVKQAPDTKDQPSIKSERTSKKDKQKSKIKDDYKKLEEEDVEVE
ncbi:MAG: hypothetical protein HRU36_00370 [Rickettsiales bacterium]|nr:hypothetical protein [Rickettsiales bacterium]